MNLEKFVLNMDMDTVLLEHEVCRNSIRLYEVKDPAVYTLKGLQKLAELHTCGPKHWFFNWFTGEVVENHIAYQNLVEYRYLKLYREEK